MDIQSLNASGVSYLWSKIKTYIDNAIEYALFIVL